MGSGNHAREYRGQHPRGDDRGDSREDVSPSKIVDLAERFNHGAGKKSGKNGGDTISLPEIKPLTYDCVVCKKPIDGKNLGEPSLVYGADPGVTTWAHIVGCRYTLKANNEAAAQKAYDAYVERQHALGNYEV